MRGFENANVHSCFQRVGLQATWWPSWWMAIRVIFFKQRFARDIEKFAFSNRVTSNWNRLPGDVVTSGNRLQEQARSLLARERVC